MLLKYAVEHLADGKKTIPEIVDYLQKQIHTKGLIAFADGSYLPCGYAIPRIQEIKENAVNDFNLRIMKPLKNSPLEEEDKEKLMSAVDKAMEKVVNKMLFGLRDSMNEKAFLECVAGLEKTYEK